MTFIFGSLKNSRLDQLFNDSVVYDIKIQLALQQMYCKTQQGL